MACFFQANCIEPINPLDNSPSIVPHQNDHKLKTHLKNMIWVTGLSCIFPTNLRRNSGGSESSEHNKAWLLAESGGSDPQSVHSSFRFTICSQIELETLKSSSCSPGATVLMVNLDNGSTDSRSRELKFSKIESLERSISPVANTLIRFGYDQLVSCTRNFSKGRVLGRGALSCVFRGRVGFLRTTVAIKRLAKEDKESANAFYRELMIASSLQNPNVVPLVGFCIHPEEGLFLVYKFVSGGSLEHHLHEKKTLPWSVRYKVAVAIAEAVSYLHVGTERCVVHRDIKPSNILLTSKKTPKLCDFGLATWTTAPSVPFLCKTVKGTFGYLAPEYFQHGKVSDKTDVYAYGVVLLELITGRKPIEAKRPPGEENLVLWAKPFLQSGKGSIEELIDIQPKLSPKKLPQIARMVQAAAACINSDESKRPSIDKIISILKGEEQLIYPDRKKLSSSGKRCIIDGHPNLIQTENDMTSHLALAMLGVSEFGDEDQSYYR